MGPWLRCSPGTPSRPAGLQQRQRRIGQMPGQHRALRNRRPCTSRAKKTCSEGRPKRKLPTAQWTSFGGSPLQEFRQTRSCRQLPSARHDASASWQLSSRHVPTCSNGPSAHLIAGESACAASRQAFCQRQLAASSPAGASPDRAGASAQLIHVGYHVVQGQGKLGEAVQSPAGAAH